MEAAFKTELPDELHVQCFASGGRPVFRLQTSRDAYFQKHAVQDFFDKLWFECLQADRDFVLPLFRGVSLSRLDAVLTSGIDVSPTDDVIWADFLEKALEYGDSEKVVLILDHRRMLRSWECLPVDAPAEQLERARAIYPYEAPTSDGKRIWFSRLSKDRPQFGSSAEAAYAWFIPGDPWQALIGLIIATTTDEGWLEAERKIRAAWGDLAKSDVPAN